MSDEKLSQNEQIFSQLRDELDESSETAVIAPRLSLKERVRITFSGFSRIKPLIIRGLIIIMAFMVVSQLVYQGITAVDKYNGGTIPMQLAIEQLGNDMPLPPEPPSINR